MKKSPRAVAVEAAPQDPRLITVPGDDTTPAGHRYNDTFGNDFRQMVDWSADHERQVLQLLATAQQHQVPIHNGMGIDYRAYNVPVEAIAVFLQSVPKAEAEADDVKKYFFDRDGHFNIVTDDGRQRRLDAVELNRRLVWIADTFVKPLWAEKTDATERRVALRNRLLDYGATAKIVAGQDTKALPPLPRGVDATAARTVGVLVAPWLTEAFVDKLVGGVSPISPAATVEWFTDAGDPIPLALRVDVRGENVDLVGDHRVLLNNIRGKDASVPTPLRVQALQYQKLLSTRNADGELVYTSTSLSRELGCSTDKINNALYYTEIAQEIRDAIDTGRIALKLCVTGRDCICYGFDKSATRQLLTGEQQLAIWGELLRAFSVEASADEGIPDNAPTRALLRKIKSEVLAGTKWADGGASRRVSKSVEASKAAAARAGVGADADNTSSTDTSALDDMRKPLSAIAGGDDDDVDDTTSRSSSGSTAKKPGASSAPASAPVPGGYAAASAPRSIRAGLAIKAKMMSTQLADFVATDRDADEDGLVLAVADAVGAYYEGGDASKLFARFPVLLEAVAGGASGGSGAGTKRGGGAATTPIAKSSRTPRPVSPLQRQQNLKDAVALAVEKVEAVGGAVTEGAIGKMLNEAADEVCAGNADAEFLVDASKLLREHVASFATKPLQEDMANHIRESLYS